MHNEMLIKEKWKNKENAKSLLFLQQSMEFSQNSETPFKLEQRQVLLFSLTWQI